MNMKPKLMNYKSSKLAIDKAVKNGSKRNMSQYKYHGTSRDKDFAKGNFSAKNYSSETYTSQAKDMNRMDKITRRKEADAIKVRQAQRVPGENHPSVLDRYKETAIKNGYSEHMSAAKSAGGDHMDMLHAKFHDSNARFTANGGWGGVGGAALRGAVVGGLGNGTFEAAQGGSFWDGAKSGAFYGAAGTAGFRVAKQRTGAKTYFGKDGIKQTNARRNQAYGVMNGDKNEGAGVRALLGHHANARMVSAANGLQR